MMFRLMRGPRGTTLQRTILSLFVVLALVSSACGSRLTKQERADAITALTRGGGGGSSTGTGSTDLGTGTGSSTGSTSSTGGGGSTTTTTGGGSTGGGSSGGTVVANSVGSCAKATKGGQ